MDFMDEIIKDAQRKGEFSNLKGEGKPLKLDEDVHTPPHLRMAHKILKENDLAPDWIEQSRALDQKYEALIEWVRRAAHDFKQARADVVTVPQPEQQRQRVERNWQRKQETLREEVGKYNREALSYNLKVPNGVTHKPMFNFEQQLSKLT